jgi:P-type Cu2+ transporter
VGYNAIALPIAAGVFEPAFGLVLRPEIAALSMSGSSFLVAANALLLKRLRLPAAALSSRTAGASRTRPPVGEPSTWPQLSPPPQPRLPTPGRARLPQLPRAKPAQPRV